MMADPKGGMKRYVLLILNKGLSKIMEYFYEPIFLIIELCMGEIKGKGVL